MTVNPWQTHRSHNLVKLLQSFTSRKSCPFTGRDSPKQRCSQKCVFSRSTSFHGSRRGKLGLGWWANKASISTSTLLDHDTNRVDRLNVMLNEQLLLVSPVNVCFQATCKRKKKAKVVATNLKTLCHVLVHLLYFQHFTLFTVCRKKKEVQLP